MTVYQSCEHYLEAGRLRFGPDENDWLFKCPACGFVFSLSDVRSAGRPSATSIVNRCIGAGGMLHSPRPALSDEGPGPCTYEDLKTRVRLCTDLILVPEEYQSNSRWMTSDNAPDYVFPFAAKGERSGWPQGERFHARDVVLSVRPIDDQLVARVARDRCGILQIMFRPIDPVAYSRDSIQSGDAIASTLWRRTTDGLIVLTVNAIRDDTQDTTRKFDTLICKREGVM